VRSSRPPPPSLVPLRIGSFDIVERIAVGGMSEVFRAEERTRTGTRTVVLKRMLPSLAVDGAAREMFEEEARLGALIDHAGVVKLLGSGEHEGQPYLVLEHVPGLDLWRLSRWLTRHGRRLEPTLVAHAGRQLLAALDAVHDTVDGAGRPVGLVHRDVSPSNILVSMQGYVKLIDFGIAEARARETPHLASVVTRPKGKLGYLAPEQVRGESTDRRVDVFAAAVVIAELLLGRPLFTGGSELAILLAIRDAEIRPFAELAGRIPDGLHGAICRALHADPAKRTPTAEALAAELAPFDREPPRSARARLASLVSEAAGTAVSGAVALSAKAPAADEATAREPTTHDAPTLEYRVMRGSTVLGPFTYAKLVEAIATREVDVGDSISEQGGPFLPLAQFTSLFRHLPPSSKDETTRRQDRPTASEEVHDLARVPLAAVLGALLLARESGLLLCSRGSARKEVYLSEGVPEFVSSNVASELLGEFLVTRGLVARDELDLALAVMPRFEGRLGETLIALGLVDPVHLVREIGAQVEERVLELFEWTSGRAEFYRGVPRPSEGFPLGIDPWRLLRCGVERRLALGLETDLLEGRLGQFVRAARPAPRGLEEASLDATLRGAIERARAGVLFGDLVALLDDPSHRDPQRGVRDAVLLVRLGALLVSP